MHLRILLVIILAFVAFVAFVALTASSVVATPSEASHGGDGHYVTARITARLAADGRVEFALQQQLSGGEWGDLVFPRARFFPTGATVDRWLVSSTLTLHAPSDSSSETDARVTARRRPDGRIEFALQDRDGDGTWGPLLFPPARYFPTTATVGRWLVSTSLAVALPPTGAAADRAALEALYRATGGQEWERRRNWLSDRPLDEWYHVDTNDEGRVIRLYLSDNNLTGHIPPELGNLSALQYLIIDRNDISGGIPPELANLTSLEVLYLSRNNLTGGIPPELGSLPRLMWLSLSRNNLTGPIPPELANIALLRTLHLHHNNLSGTIPPKILAFSQRVCLRLEGNSFSPPPPEDLGPGCRLADVNTRASNDGS